MKKRIWPTYRPPSAAKLQAAVDKLPAPRRGVMYHFRSVETMCLYLQKHGLEPQSWRGGVLIADYPKKAETNE